MYFLKNKILISLFTVSFFLGIGLNYSNATSSYVPLSPIPGFSNSSNSNISAGASGGSSSTGFADYLKKIYQFGVGLATVLAVLMIMWGGVEYMTTDAIGGKEEGKERIQSAVLGLLLALGSYIILNTINPNLLSLKFAIVETTVKTSDIESNYVTTGTSNGTSTSGNTSSNSGSTSNNSTTGQVSNNSLTSWGDSNASSMVDQTISGRQTYYAAGEDISDSNTDAGLGSYGKLIEGNATTVGSAASVYYPAGTLVEVNGTKYIIDDNNLVKNKDGTFTPANNNLTNNYTVDIYTTDVSKANTQDSNYSMKVLYVPNTTEKMTSSKIQDIRNNPSNYINQ